jgi:hypothetical protein
MNVAHTCIIAQICDIPTSSAKLSRAAIYWRSTYALFRDLGVFTAGTRGLLCLHRVGFVKITRKETIMLPIIALAVPVAAVGYSLLYLLLGGGFGGAVIIFILAKMLGK